MIAILAGVQSGSFAQGNGLQGEYKSGALSMKRTDSVVSFNWGTQAPASSLPADNFTVQWTGQVEAPVTGAYTFNIQADDSLRIWVDGKQVIDATSGYYPAWYVSPYINLVAGRKYDIRVEYAEKTGNAAVQLAWTYPGQTRQVIPQSRLYSTPVTNNPNPPAPPNNPQTPSAPLNLAAVGAWRDSCCNGQSMAHIALSWQQPTNTPVAIRSYNIYRDGTLIQRDVTGTSWEDMGVSSGQNYTYQVSGVAASGQEGAKSGSASATAPFPPSAWTAPTNLRIQGIWDVATNRPTDVLTWDAVAGATKYNIYQYDNLIGTVTSGTSFTVPANNFYLSMTYAVSAVDNKGLETLPSNIVSAQGANNPAFPPNGVTNSPTAPYALQTATEWNAGAPRVRVTWQGGTDAYTYDIYRDGAKVARGVWGQVWFDNNVRVGETHTYRISGLNLPWKAQVESPLSTSVSATVTAAPVITPGARVTITRVVPNDDSVMVYFNAVPGAVDYRVYDATKPGAYKYSAGSLSVEVNGLKQGTATNLVVEAVDKLGPFQKMDGMLGPGSTGHDGHIMAATNGQGDPSNIPVVLAASQPFPVSCAPRSLTGAQAFFDTFRNSQPFVSAPVPGPLANAFPNQVAAVQNDKWLIYNVMGDLDTSRVFVMSDHFMDTVYDGGSPSSGTPLHTNNASLVMQPKQFADISNGKVVHITFEVDAHFSSRRWCDVIVAGADDTLLNPGAFWNGNQLPTITGQIFRWEILPGEHTAQVFRGKDSAGNLIAVKLFDQEGGVGPDNSGPPSRVGTTWSDVPPFNGTIQDTDKRHRFDLYLSKNRFRVMEEGKLVKDKVFPNGITLPFNRAAIYFVHEVYHSSAERNELQMYQGTDAYWVNHRPYADERHWDNMGFEVLDSFPAITP